MSLRPGRRSRCISYFWTTLYESSSLLLTFLVHFSESNGVNRVLVIVIVFIVVVVRSE